MPKIYNPDGLVDHRATLMNYEPIRKAHSFQRRVWEAVYARVRRKHAHRCPFCSRVLKSGEAAVMWRGGNKTRAAHDLCANAYEDGAPRRAVIDVWAYGDEAREHARRQGVEL